MFIEYFRYSTYSNVKPPAELPIIRLGTSDVVYRKKNENKLLQNYVGTVTF